jgi:hypothetical protein
MDLTSSLFPSRNDADSESNSESGAEPALEGVELDDLLGALANERRRITLRHVAAHEGPVGKGTLAELVAADELDVPVETLTGKERKSVYVALHQSHLEVLDDAGLVEWDEAKVRPTPAIDAALDVLDHADDLTGEGDA